MAQGCEVPTSCAEATSLVVPSVELLSPTMTHHLMELVNKCWASKSVNSIVGALPHPCPCQATGYYSRLKTPSSLKTPPHQAIRFLELLINQVLSYSTPIDIKLFSWLDHHPN